MVGFATGLGMAPPATGGSEVSPCGEVSSKQPQIGFSLLSLSVLGTGTPSPGTSETSPRGETVISPTSLRLVIFTEHANMPYTHLERHSACSVFCLKGPSATDTGFRHPEPPHDRSPSVLGLFFGQI